ncbi:MAG: YidC/Oxa1 family membrane protein insertase, partial [Clostridia bacterium]|nr:YidC/Oxa1 family membrane protein insertase [Clostridia bacterium]
AHNLPATAEFTTDEIVTAVEESAAYLSYTDGNAVKGRFLTKEPESEEQLWELLEAKSFDNYAEINAVTYVSENREKFIEYFNETDRYEKGDVTAEDIVSALPEMEIKSGSGFNFGAVPNIGILSAEKLGSKLLFLVPVLTLVTAYFGQALTRKFTYQPAQAEEVKNQMRMMNIFMPLFSFYISTIVPAGVGVYWMMSNILSPVQQFTLSKLFPIKEITPEELKEAERLYGGKQKKKKSSGDSTGKRRSLVYDDDDEYESVSTTTEKKKVLTEKKQDEKSIVEKAPLKDEEK